MKKVNGYVSVGLVTLIIGFLMAHILGPISDLKAKVERHDESIENIEKKLDRIEQKVDLLIERG